MDTILFKDCESKVGVGLCLFIIFFSRILFIHIYGKRTLDTLAIVKFFMLPAYR